MHNAPRASVLRFLLVLMLSVYTWGYFWPAYTRRSNVSVPAGSGRYNDDVGALPVGSQLSLVPLSHALNHSLQDEVSDLKFLRLYLLVVSGLDLLLIGCNAGLGLLSSFLWVIQYQVEQGVFLILNHPFHWNVSMLMSTRIIASISYASENGVSLVGTRLVVL